MLGIGSPFGEDSLGWQAIDGLIGLGLPERLASHEVVLEKADRPGVLLLEHMRGMDAVFLIDALVGGGEPGRLHCLGLDELAQEERLLSGHGLGVAEALALGEALGDLPGQVLVLGIEVEPPAQIEPPKGGDSLLDAVLLQGIIQTIEERLI